MAARAARVVCGRLETDFGCLRDLVVASFVAKSVRNLDTGIKELSERVGMMEGVGRWTDVEAVYAAVARKISMHCPVKARIAVQLLESIVAPASKEEFPSWVPNWHVPKWDVCVPGARPFDVTYA